MQHFFCFANRFRGAGEFWKEGHGIGDLPANIDCGQEVIAILGQTFSELILEILDPLIEAMQHLNAPGQPKIKSRLGDGLAGGLAKCGYHHDFRLAHLKCEQQQGKDEQQESSDDESEWTSFHTCLLFRRLDRGAAFAQDVAANFVLYIIDEHVVRIG